MTDIDRTSEDVAALERRIHALNLELVELRKRQPGIEVPNYSFATRTGTTTLKDLFGDQQRLLMIHNMGQGCRYCTLWADGFNGLLTHLESVMAVALASRDAPAVQRRFANARGWRFTLVSHGGGDYIREQTVMAGEHNAPGAVLYERHGEGIVRRNACVFGPGDPYCSMWSLLGLAGIGSADWTPQFSYWQRPARLDDGGENLPD